jgi:hypothetical protein
MADNFYKDEFEQFLQQEANQHRLYPGDRVWQNINKKIHGHKRWPGLTIAGLFLLVSVVAVSIYFQPNPSLFVLQPIEQPIIDKTIAAITAKPNVLTAEPGKSVEFDVIKQLAESTNEGAESIPPTTTLANTTTAIAEVNNGSKNTAPAVTNTPSIPTHFNVAANNTIVAESTFPQESNKFISTTDTTAVIVNTNTTPEKPKRTDETGEKNAVDKFLAEQAELADILKQAKPSVNNKWNFHFYVTPSQSYRNLKEDQNFEKAHAAALNSALTFNTPGNLNNAAKHKPALGMEIGAGVSYNVTDRIRLKTGLQFNLRQYKIDAYMASTEMTTISLITNNALNTFSVYRTNNGNQAIELTNKYYQLSIPVGFEWDAMHKNKFKWTVAAAIQPSLQLNRNALLMSTDYKNYTESPSLLRTWNINSSLETFVSYKIGDYNWQIGPQIRYQHLPTFNKKYPIRENLLDYGVKIGFTKVIQ